MQSGKINVTGRNSIRIPLTGFVREVCVRFEHEHEHVPCNPHHHDRLEWEIECEDEDRRRHHDHEHEHHHEDRKFILVIRWEVSGMREIEWFVVD